MNDEQTNVSQLKALVRDFSQDRDWEQFHHPKDLGVALAIEVGEVLEHFRYRDNKAIAEHLVNPGQKRALGHELADCLWLLLRLADVCGIDLSAALEEKVALAGEKYPADLVRGKPHKYTHYRTGE